MPRMTLRFMLALACAVPGVTPSPAFADGPRGLPDGWVMADDATYVPVDRKWRYKVPEPRRGTYAHGASGEFRAAPGIDAQKVRDECYRRTGSYPAWPEADGEEYWYFEADGEALLLLKTNVLDGYTAQCTPIIGSSYSVQRAMIGRDGFTSFVDSGSGWRSETHRFDEYRRAAIKDIGIGIGGPALTRFVVRKRRLDDSDVGAVIGKVQTHCIAYSSPPDAGGGQCWIAGPGPGKGIVTSDYEIFAGSPYIFQAVTELEDNVAIDGRLFEWDRTIRGRDMTGK